MLAEQKAGGYSAKYRFTGKEVDEETGLYYFITLVRGGSDSYNALAVSNSIGLAAKAFQAGEKNWHYLMLLML